MNTNEITRFEYQKQFSLKYKVALVTGAAGHLGKAMSYCLGQAGAHVLLNGRDKDKLKMLQDDLNKEGIESTILPYDITQKSALTDMMATISSSFKYLDIVVNNAHSGRAGSYHEAQPEDFYRDYNIDVVAAFELIKTSRQLLKNAVSLHGDASIINIASMYGMVSPDPRIYLDSKMNNPPYYGAAKAGLIQLTKYMACHLAEDKIRVNAISPGPFPSEAVMNQQPQFAQNLIAKVPLARIGYPAELQGPLLFLASNASSYITGINLPVDGGWTAW